MSLWAILPVKPLEQGKTRLSAVLSKDERWILNTTMLGNTLKALIHAKGVDRILVVSQDPAVLAASRSFGVQILQEEPLSNLNRAVTLGVRFAVAHKAGPVMVLPADLPLLDAALIQLLVGRLTGVDELIILPDRRDEGTNGLLISPPDLFKYQFGVDSFRRHIHQAQENGMRVEIVRIPELSLDLDLPEDLDLLQTTLIAKS
jgi:2-phospho-L-lactate/phosphoenolpyruvate guanylyltransferase